MFIVVNNIVWHYYTLLRAGFDNNYEQPRSPPLGTETRQII